MVQEVNEYVIESDYIVVKFPVMIRRFRPVKSKGKQLEVIIEEEKDSTEKEETIRVSKFVRLSTGEVLVMEMFLKEILPRVRLNKGVAEELTI